MQTAFSIQPLEQVIAPMKHELCTSWGPGWIGARIVLGGISLGIGLLAYCAF